VVLVLEDFQKMQLRLIDYDEEFTFDFDVTIDTESDLYDVELTHLNEEYADLEISDLTVDNLLEYLKRDFKYFTVDFILELTPVDSNVSFIYGSSSEDRSLIALSLSEERPFVSEEIRRSVEIVIESVSRSLNISIPEEIELIKIALTEF